MDDRLKSKVLNGANPILRTRLNLNQDFLVELQATNPAVLSDLFLNCTFVCSLILINAVIMDDRDTLSIVLNRANPILRKYLNINQDFLVELKATNPAVLSDEECEDIKAKAVMFDKVDELINLLKRKPIQEYLSFMGVLQEKDRDLHLEVKAIHNEFLPNFPLPGPMEEKCAKHPNEIMQLYCKTCRKLVCKDCILIKQLCRDHDYVSRQDVSKEIFSEEDLLHDKVASPTPTGSFQYECDKHPEVLTTYHCFRCDVAVCRDCILTRQHSHDDDQNTSETEVMNEIRTESNEQLIARAALTTIDDEINEKYRPVFYFWYELISMNS